MKFFIDTANIDEIRSAKSWGCLDGVTTNPSLYAKIGGKLSGFDVHMAQICEICKGMPVCAESTANTVYGMIEEGRRLHNIAPNMVVKFPISPESLAATNVLAQEGIDVNMTLIFTAPQALLAARAGARYISPFVGRYDDISESGVAHLDEIVACLYNYDFGHEVEIIAASLRSPDHVTQAALIGVDIATVPLAVLKKCLHHPLTTEGIRKFEADWRKVVDTH